ncbi:LuxR C-terminal-related transcriptional regulator [Herbiconiux sp. CPCC 205763]|uniref:LuxR C-terminal-related transcriptional regulator n=1 Tax=Herbiconiux aconitum TaxID=2970913 RepID=A0ABT2GTW6_9MICO|nr:HD domain-containing phosphohydrolase [Herbiconiux aconitum]MCS5718755.1 LuxR C-terminal-related transcriptional regulator [Herbiconiux aconitum]
MTVAARLPRRVEVLAGLSVAIDLGLGQPAEHMLRSAVVACGLADRLGLSRQQKSTVYYTTLLMWIGCHADSHEYARWFGDDIAVRREAYLVDWSGMPYLRFLVGNVARGEPLGERVRVMATLMRDARGQLATLIHSHCASAALLGRHIGLDADVERALAYTFERFDGGGLPAGVSGADIPIEMRVAQLADVAEVHHRLYGVEGTVALARSRRGGQFDPAVVDAYTSDPEALFPAPGDDPWERALSIAPEAGTRLDESQLDVLLTAIGDFADLKCPFALGHSRSVAALAEAAAVQLALPADDVTAIRRAGHLHDIGRIGVSNQVWSKPAELTGAEWERVRMYPYLTDRVLTRITGLDHVAAIARAHHEHLDGSGYPLGLSGAALGRPERILAAAVAYRSALEPRPYREPLTPEGAAARLRNRVSRGHLDPDSADAVLAVAGHVRSRAPRDDSLTPRETEILGLVARGLSNREIAHRLVLSEKTVRNHVERSYTKIGASNRVGASLFALEHGLVAPVDGL